MGGIDKKHHLDHQSKVQLEERKMHPEQLKLVLLILWQNLWKTAFGYKIMTDSVAT